MESEIAKVDGSLKGSIVGLSDQMRSIIDGIPSRLTSMTRETLQALESNLERSFEGVAQRSEKLNDEFRQNATDTTEAVLESYVDFIFLALKRFRSEMDVLNGTFRKELEASMAAMPVHKEPFAINKPADIEITGSLASFRAGAEPLISIARSDCHTHPRRQYVSSGWAQDGEHSDDLQGIPVLNWLRTRKQVDDVHRRAMRPFLLLQAREPQAFPRLWQSPYCCTVAYFWTAVAAEDLCTQDPAMMPSSARCGRHSRASSRTRAARRMVR